MGRRNRERVARILAGAEEPRAARKILAAASRRGVVRELSKGSVTDQVGRLDSLVGTGELSGGRLRSAIMSKAPGEMDKAIRKFQKQGKEVTVDALCSEVKSTPEFLRMCNNVGITVEWFEELAKARMEAHRL